MTLAQVTLTEDQLMTLTAILRERIESRRADRAELVAAGAPAGLLQMADLALTSLAELHTQCLLARAVLDVQQSKVEHLLPIGVEEMLQRTLGVGPADIDTRYAMAEALRRAAGEPSQPLRVRVDDSGATGTQRSDWGERGEGSEEP